MEELLGVQLNYNTFILNWVDNYEKQVQNLKETMVKLRNHVKVYNHLKYDELIEVMNELRKTEFDALHEYIAVIVLDNKSKNKRFITTSDNKHVLLDTQIFTVLQTNPTLKDKPRLFLTQKLGDWRDYDDDEENNDDEVDKVPSAVEKVSNDERYDEAFQPTQHYAVIKGKLYRVTKSKVLYQGLKITIDAEEQSENFHDSPFIQIFCDTFEEYANAMDIDKICNIVRKRVRTIPGFESYQLVFGSDQRKDNSLIFGSALTSNALRDFS